MTFLMATSVCVCESVAALSQTKGTKPLHKRPGRARAEKCSALKVWAGSPSWRLRGS